MITAVIVQCYNCHQVFNLKNTLFYHLYSKTNKITCCSKGKMQASQPTAMLAKPLSKLLKIVSVSSVTKDIETGYEF